MVIMILIILIFALQFNLLVLIDIFRKDNNDLKEYIENYLSNRDEF